jgi:hypothetical protein
MQRFLYFLLFRRAGSSACALRTTQTMAAACRRKSCTVHKHRNLLAHAPKKLYDQISAEYTDMIYANTAKEVEQKRKAFLRKWRLKCRAVADSLEEAGDRLHGEFKRRIKTQFLLPCAEQRGGPSIERCNPPGGSLGPRIPRRQAVRLGTTHERNMEPHPGGAVIGGGDMPEIGRGGRSSVAPPRS